MRVPELPAPLGVGLLGIAASVALAAPGLPMPVRAAAAGALAFALPGTALALALMPGAVLRHSERLAIGVGGSLSAAVAAAFVLHLLPGGLAAGSWAALLGGVTVLGGVVGWLRTRRAPTPPAHGDASTSSGAPWVVGPPATAVRLELVSPASLAMLVASGVLLVLALVLARAGVALGPTASFTELWMLPADGGASMQVGVANHEGAPTTYRLVVTVDGQRLGRPSEITLPDGGATDIMVALPPRGTAPSTVEARLWRADRPAAEPPARTVRATVGGSEGQAP